MKKYKLKLYFFIEVGKYRKFYSKTQEKRVFCPDITFV